MMIRTSRVLITPPEDDVMTVAECKSALGITTTSQDGMIGAALDAAVCSLDPAFGGWLGRALRPQTWEYRLAEFPYCDGYSRRYEFPYRSEEIRLPYPTLTSVTSIKYDDANGDEQTLVEGTDYNVMGVNGFSYGSVTPCYNKSWPSARRTPESVRIRYVCGYEDDIPPAISQAIALMVKSVFSAASQNMFVTMDRVEGIGEKRYSVTQQAISAMTSVADNILFNYRPIAI